VTATISASVRGVDDCGTVVAVRLELLFLFKGTIYKGGIVFSEHKSTAQFSFREQQKQPFSLHIFNMEESPEKWLKLYVVDIGIVNIHARMAHL
jgi:hypothetical protein